MLGRGRDASRRHKGRNEPLIAPCKASLTIGCAPLPRHTRAGVRRGSCELPTFFFLEDPTKSPRIELSHAPSPQPILSGSEHATPTCRLHAPASMGALLSPDAMARHAAHAVAPRNGSPFSPSPSTLSNCRVSFIQRQGPAEDATHPRPLRSHGSFRAGSRSHYRIPRDASRTRAGLHSGHHRLRQCSARGAHCHNVRPRSAFQAILDALRSRQVRMWRRRHQLCPSLLGSARDVTMVQTPLFRALSPSPHSQPARFQVREDKLSCPCRSLARTQSRENPRGHEKRHGEHFSLHVLRLPRTSYITSPVLGARRNVNLPPTRRVLLTCYLREAAKRAVGLRRNHGDAWRCAGLENSNPPKPPDFGQGTFDRSKNHTRKLKCSKDPSRGSCVDAPT